MCPDCELCSQEYIAHALIFYFDQTYVSTFIQWQSVSIKRNILLFLRLTSRIMIMKTSPRYISTWKSEHREKVNILGNTDSNSRSNDDFHCLMSKMEAYVLELLSQMKICIEFDKEVLLHTAKQLCSLKNALISSKNTSKQKHQLISKYCTPFKKSVET